MNFYPFHVGDYAAHTKHLTLIEDLAYRRMLDLYYISESPLPLEPEKVARLIGMRDHVKEVSDVLSDFFLKSDAGHISKRIEEEISRYHAKADRAKAANASRWAKEKSDTDLKSDTKSDLKSDALQIPTNNQEPEPEPIKEKTKAKRAVAQPASPGLDLPGWLPEEIWSSFVEMRKRIKAPLTAKAAELIIRDLCKLCDEGHNPVAVIEQSIARSWRGVFPVKGGSSVGGNGGADAVDFFKEEARKMRANGGSQ